MDGEGSTSEPTEQQHLYLIFDDWEWGYSIRRLELPLRSPHQPSSRPLEQRPEQKRLPPACICLEAPRRRPTFFAAVGTDVIAAYPRNGFSDAPMIECFVPIFDGRSLGVRFGPGLSYAAKPILIPVGDEELLFALDLHSFRMLSMKPLGPRREWSWRDLPPPPIKSIEVTSFVVGSDGRTIFASTDCATFAFDILNSEWKQSSDCSLPFAGPANYVHALDIFVGLSKTPETYGHLCFCRKLGGDDEKVRISKENLLIKDPASHVGATLVYSGGSEPAGFCLVECFSITEGNKRPEECDQLVKCVDEGGVNCRELDQQLKKNVDEGDGASGSMQECGELDELKKFVDVGDGVVSGSMRDDRYLYRLTTFSLSFDNNGDLTTGETCVVQCYKVSEEVSEAIYLFNPVAFWL